MQNIRHAACYRTNSNLFLSFPIMKEKRGKLFYYNKIVSRKLEMKMSG